ncbi:MAG: polyhydroxyalkanoate synthesis regulator DNA-binding domain-containing protein [Candidatus Dormibacteraceae bacterium]
MSEPATHLIRKYANRKLYDTSTSRYITLSGIWALVCAGHDVRVVDHETGNDITAVVLSQIVASHERTTAIEQTPAAEQAAEARRDTLLDYLRRTIGRPAALVGDEVGRRGTELAAAVQDGLNEMSDDLGRRGSELAAELSRRTVELGRRRSEMEDAVEAAVGRAFESFSFSSRRDLSQLRRRVEELEKRVASVQAALQADLEESGATSGARPD